MRRRVAEKRAAWFTGGVSVLTRQIEFVTSSPDLAGCPPPELPEFAFIGRSNVGKSSLLNLIVGKKGLARVSATPGHTRLINFFRTSGGAMLVDLPGYGYAKTGKATRERFSETIAEYLAGRGSLALVFVLIDARLTPQAIDLEFIEWLAERELRMALVFTKTDKVKPRAMQANVVAFVEKLAEICEGKPEVFISSSRTGAGRRELLGRIGEALVES